MAPASTADVHTADGDERAFTFTSLQNDGTYATCTYVMSARLEYNHAWRQVVGLRLLHRGSDGDAIWAVYVHNIQNHSLDDAADEVYTKCDDLYEALRHTTEPGLLGPFRLIDVQVHAMPDQPDTPLQPNMVPECNLAEPTGVLDARDSKLLLYRRWFWC
jgi:hypothetical protein